MLYYILIIFEDFFKVKYMEKCQVLLKELPVIKDAASGGCLLMSVASILKRKGITPATEDLKCWNKT